ncbi:MAG: GMC family oxidoreductase [Actinobacteria bacterium]|nr:GMC family oxidoreductase [Actinomycetota bacterium]
MEDTHFDAVIVGSGFGGSVMAYRLTEAGLRVCILERGKAYPPDSFPRAPHRMKKNFWDPSEGLYGMFNVWSFRGLGAIVSSGLGGGSLIYANVLIRKDEKWFVEEDLSNGYEYWPVTREDLDPHYDRVEEMLGAQRYPFDREPYSGTSKTRALKGAAERLGLDWRLPNLAVTFANEGEDPVPGEPIREKHPNLHHRTRYTCRLCGECDIGCNVQTITADRLILAAGALGSTFLLLKNRGAFPGLSERLGARFSGNGDLVTFAVRAREEVDGKKVPRMIDPGHGPAITSAIRVADRADGGQGRGFYVEDAGYPEFVNWMLQMVDTPGSLRLWWRSVGRHLVRKWLGRDPETDIGAEIAGLFGTSELSSGMLPLLGMGRDIPDGNMRLRKDKLDVDWRIGTSRPYFERVRKTMRDIAGSLEADFRDNPTWYLSRLITVHPLGGCPMGRNEREGVVDPYGEVFNYPGLYVADGSVMPGPVGPNPSLTIAALADRFADGIVQ